MKSIWDLWCYCISSCCIRATSWFESQKCMNKPHLTCNNYLIICFILWAWGICLWAIFLWIHNRRNAGGDWGNKKNAKITRRHKKISRRREKNYEAPRSTRKGLVPTQRQCWRRRRSKHRNTSSNKTIQVFSQLGNKSLDIMINLVWANNHISGYVTHKKYCIYACK